MLWFWAVWGVFVGSSFLAHRESSPFWWKINFLWAERLFLLLVRKLGFWAGNMSELSEPCQCGKKLTAKEAVELQKQIFELIRPTTTVSLGGSVVSATIAIMALMFTAYKASEASDAVWEVALRFSNLTIITLLFLAFVSWCFCRRIERFRVLSEELAVMVLMGQLRDVNSHDLEFLIRLKSCLLWVFFPEVEWDSPRLALVVQLLVAACHKEGALQ
jgi:hypothetical protein